MKLPKSEELDFHYLLSLMRPLHQIDEFCWLPELFSIIGHQSLLKLAKYAGGETIRIPTLEELETAIESLGWYYKVYILHKKRRKSIPFEYLEQVDKIKEVFDAADS